jgi:hypothetical protein
VPALLPFNQLRTERVIPPAIGIVIVLFGIGIALFFSRPNLVHDLANSTLRATCAGAERRFELDLSPIWLLSIGTAYSYGVVAAVSLSAKAWKLVSGFGWTGSSAA